MFRLLLGGGRKTNEMVKDFVTEKLWNTAQKRSRVIKTLKKIDSHADALLAETLNNKDYDTIKKIHPDVETLIDKYTLGEIETPKQLWKSLSSFPEVQFDLLSRALYKKFPDSYGKIDTLLSDISQNKKIFGELLGKYRDHAGDYLRKKGIFVSGKNIEGLYDNIDRVFPVRGKRAYEATLNKKMSAEYETIKQAYVQFILSRPGIMDIPTLQKFMKQELVKNMGKAGASLWDKMSDKEKKILTEEILTRGKAQRFKLEGEEFVINPNKFKTVLPDIEQFILTAKKKLQPFKEFSRENNPLSNESRRFFAIMGADFAELYEKLYPQYKDYLKEYSANSTLLDVLSEIGSPNVLSWFQARSVMPGQVGGMSYPEAAKGALAWVPLKTMRWKRNYPEYAYKSQDRLAKYNTSRVNPVEGLMNMLGAGQSTKDLSKTFIKRSSLQSLTEAFKQPEETGTGQSIESYFNDVSNAEKKKLNEDDQASFDMEVKDMRDRVNALILQTKDQQTGTLPVDEMESEDIVNTAVNPDYLLQKISEGTLLKRDAQNFKQINPWLYHRMALDLYLAQKEGILELDYMQTQALENFVDRELIKLKGGFNNEKYQPAKAITRDGRDQGFESYKKASKGLPQKVAFQNDKRSQTDRFANL